MPSAVAHSTHVPPPSQATATEAAEGVSAAAGQATMQVTGWPLACWCTNPHLHSVPSGAPAAAHSRHVCFKSHSDMCLYAVSPLRCARQASCSAF